MKAIFILLFCIPLFVFSQDNSWFEPGTSWTYNYQNWSGPDHYQVNFEISESVLAGQACAKMETVGEYPFLCAPFETPFYFYESNDSVFYASEVDNTFRLAYNFNAEPGDSWDFSIPLPEGVIEPYTVEVIEVNSLVVDGNNLKEMILNYQNVSEQPQTEIFPEEFSVIEFIGSTKGLFVPFGQLAFCDAETAIHLQCFNSSSISYINPDFETCFLSVHDIQNPLMLTFYPNPATDFITLETPFEYNSKVRIIQPDGKSVLFNTITSQSARIDLPQLSSGVYFVEILNAENRYVGKLIVR